MGIGALFAFSKKKKVDAARFLDARSDEKQVINLERPNQAMQTGKQTQKTNEIKTISRSCVSFQSPTYEKQSCTCHGQQMFLCFPVSHFVINQYF